MRFGFDNTYARLPARFFERVLPTKVPNPRVVRVNRGLAELLGLDPDALSSSEGALVLSGNTLPDDAEPLALAYAGHQFGGFVPQLGDGRAILLGELIGRDGRRRDVQLKGAGRTPFSRGGDGRAALGPVMREYVVSEAMAALGVPTTRALAMVTTGEAVVRNEMLPGAVFSRVAASHIRVGTFEFFAARDDRNALDTLATYTLARHYPDGVGSGNDALALFKHTITAQAELVARWLGVGFVHGVMNTDNTAVSGETIDYGPCAFLDAYDPKKRFSSIDRGGRYAFASQPTMAQWNLSRLAKALLPLLADDEQSAVAAATECLDRFPELFGEAYGRVMRAKLGIGGEAPGDLTLQADLLARMATNGVDYTLFFRKLCDAAVDDAHDAEISALFSDPGAFHAWAAAWRHRLAGDSMTPELRAGAMRRANPAIIPRNHRIEEAIEAAVRRDDFAPFETLVRAFERPYEDVSEFEHLRKAPTPSERVRETFCGT